MAAIDENEFERWMQVLRGDIRGVHDRLDELNGRTRKNEASIAVLEDRGAEGRTSGVAWGGGVAVLVSGVLEGLHWYLSR